MVAGARAIYLKDGFSPTPSAGRKTPKRRGLSPEIISDYKSLIFT